MNFWSDVVVPQDGRALVEAGVRDWSFAEVADAAAGLAGALHAAGVRRGDVVLTLIGNRPEWVVAMVACFRQGYVVLPCNEQLRAKDLRMRLDVCAPAAVVADPRNAAVLTAAGWTGPTLWRDAAEAPPPADLAADDPCLITFTSGTAGEPKAVLHAQRYLPGQRLQADTWLAPDPGALVWCTAASGWSKSARNVFIAPWLRGAAALLHDARFDPAERLELLERERVDVLCMAPTEYRVMAKRVDLRPLPALKGLVAAGEALNPEVLRAWHEATGVWVRDGYGQTETGQLTGHPPGVAPKPGSMGRPLEGIDLVVEDGELVLRDPSTDPTVFLGYLEAGEGSDRGFPSLAASARAGQGTPPPAASGITGSGVPRPAPPKPGRGSFPMEIPLAASGEDPRPGQRPKDKPAPWHTGDRVTIDEDGYLFFEGRTDDVIISSGYRIGPFEVESALVAHEAVAEAAVVAAPDDERGSVVRAVVVLRDGFAPSDDLASALQQHVKDVTAPYKYPRIVDFADALPKTTSGKVRRAVLRNG